MAPLTAGGTPLHWKRSTWFWLLRLLITGMLLGVCIRLTRDPLIWPDSASYIYQANGIRTGELALDFEVRTPTYSLFLLLVGVSLERAVVIQMVLGLVTTVLAFWKTWEITCNDLVATLAAAIYGLHIIQIQLEISILTETLSTFLLLLTIALFIQAWKKLDRSENFAGYYWAIGLTSGLLVLARPGFLFLFVLLFIVAMFKAYITKTNPWPALGILIPAIILVFGWSAYNYQRLGFFGLSSLVGYNLTDLTGNYFEMVPEMYKQIRDIYLAYRPQQMAIYNAPRGTQWISLPEVANETGLSFVELSRIYQKIAMELILRHPDLFAQMAWKSWINHWMPQPLQAWPNVYPEAHKLYSFFGLAWILEMPISQTINFLFLLLTYSWFVILAWLSPGQLLEWAREDHHLILVTLVSIVIISALSHSVLAFGEPRYSMPLQPLMACVLFSSIWFATHRRRKIYSPETKLDEFG